jgi:hypothetical protein
MGAAYLTIALFNVLLEGIPPEKHESRLNVLKTYKVGYGSNEGNAG